MAGERLGSPAEDLNEESRLRRIERQLPLTTFTPSASDVEVGDTVPQVSGLSITDGPRSLTIKWNDSNIPQAEFDYYEVNISNDTSFSPSFQLKIDRTQDLQYSYYQGDPNTTYYARVRAVLNDGRTGAFTPILNTTTGLIVADDFTPESLIVPDTAFTAGTLAVAAADGEVTIQSLSVTPTNQPLAFLASFQHVLTSGSSAASPVRLKRGSTTLVDAFITAKTNDDTVSYVFLDESPGTATVTYSITLDAVSGTVTVSNRSLLAIELKR